jgi:hypothetical protein
MGMNSEEFAPVAFNPYKHHLEFLKQKITGWKLLPWDEVEKEIFYIGTNLTDVYYGNLTVREIHEEIVEFAAMTGLTDASKLTVWLGHEQFRKVALSDLSQWVIRQGLNAACFLHIHPAKHSLFTLRIRASTLKTVIVLKLTDFGDREELPQLHVVNLARTRMPGLSPIKRLEQDKGILRIWGVFNKQ